jgi:hypothetical protein
MNRRTLLALAASACAAPAFAAATRPVVVELFTSQGCSSCPPADAMLKKLQDRPGLITLSYHVDYWDYLGWRDTLGSAELSQRQYDYAKSRGDMNVYTPQLIVDGVGHVVGSHQSEVTEAIDGARRKPASTWVDLSMSSNDTDITVELGAAEDAGKATLWLMAVKNNVTVPVERGENAGHSIAYVNVVRKMSAAAMWDGKSQRIVLPKAGVVPEGCTSWVALLQQGKVGPIIGAATGGAPAS